MLRGPRLLLAALLGLLLLEVIVFVVVVQQIGFGWTLLAMVTTSVVGAVVVRRAGTRALGELGAAVRNGQPPRTDLADAGGVVVAGLLLVTPGFVGDAAGALLLLRPVRIAARRALGGLAASLTLGRVSVVTRQRPGHDDVVRGEIVDPPEGS